VLVRLLANIYQIRSNNYLSDLGPVSRSI